MRFLNSLAWFGISKFGRKMQKQRMPVPRAAPLTASRPGPSFLFNCRNFVCLLSICMHDVKNGASRKCVVSNFKKCGPQIIYTRISIHTCNCIFVDEVRRPWGSLSSSLSHAIGRSALLHRRASPSASLHCRTNVQALDFQFSGCFQHVSTLDPARPRT